MCTTINDICLKRFILLEKFKYNHIKIILECIFIINWEKYIQKVSYSYFIRLYRKSNENLQRTSSVCCQKIVIKLNKTSFDSNEALRVVSFYLSLYNFECS